MQQKPSAPARSDAVVWAGLLIAVGAVGLLVLFDFEIQDAVIAVLMFTVVINIGKAVRGPSDGWLMWLIPLAYFAKLAGATFRHYTVTVVYNSGDALTYFGFAEDAIHAWRNLQLPVSIGRSAGTRFIEVFTSFVFAPYMPTILGGFIIFATIAFLGQLLFYLAYRRAMPHIRLKWYALAIFFLPSLLFWPSSIGKESSLMLFLGAATYGAVLMFEGKWLTGIPLIAAGMGLTAAVRPHVAALVAGALVMALMFGSMTQMRGGRFARFLLIGVALAGLFAAFIAVNNRFGVSLNQQEVEEFQAQVVGQTDTGGSAIDAQPVTSPAQIPDATLRVLFRPLINEAGNLQARLSAVESTVLFFLTLVALPRIISNVRAIRRYPYLAFSVFFTGGFVIAFSSISNAGILSRQRVQVIPYFMVFFLTMTIRKRDLDAADDDTSALEAELEALPEPPSLIAAQRAALKAGHRYAVPPVGPDVRRPTPPVPEPAE